MGRAGFNRKTAYATLTMLLAAEAADCDVLWELKGPIATLQHHRGITHSFLGAPFIAAATVFGVYLLHRWWLGKRKPRAGYPPVRWTLLYGLALLASLSHLLLDYTTAYGVRLFEPFNYRWYSWDIVYIIEPVILIALLLGLAVPALLRLVNQEVGARSKGPGGRGGAIFALCCVIVVWGYRDFQHRRALAAMSAITYGGASASRVAAYPYMINPFRWHGVVETRDFLQTLPVSSSPAAVDPQNEARTFYKPEETAVTRAAKESYFGRVYLDWAVFPTVETQKLEGDPNGYLVDFVDLRYDYPEHTALAGFAFLSPTLHVEAQGMNSARPAWLLKR